MEVLSSFQISFKWVSGTLHAGFQRGLSGCSGSFQRTTRRPEGMLQEDIRGNSEGFMKAFKGFHRDFKKSHGGQGLQCSFRRFLEF